MAAGTLWWLRVPEDSTPWLALISVPSSLVPPLATLFDPLPAIALLGIGIACVVAPLTSTLMDSVPVARAGLALEEAARLASTESFHSAILVVTGLLLGGRRW